MPLIKRSRFAGSAPRPTGCGHPTHVGTCPDCQQRELDRAKRHIIQSIKARAQWEASNGR